jgi:hypothetical protein
MNAILTETKNASMRFAKLILFGLIGVMMLIVLKMDLRVFNPKDPIWEHYRTFKWWLLPHAMTAGLALILGPLQFSDQFRRRFRGSHRLLGRVYVFGVIIGAPLGVWIEYFNFSTGNGSSLRMVAATCGTGAAFLLTTGLGFFTALQRNFKSHQNWMTRSYGVALVFLEVRCVEQVPWLAKLAEWPVKLLESHSMADLWFYLALSLLVAEGIICWERRPGAKL